MNNNKNNDNFSVPIRCKICNQLLFKTAPIASGQVEIEIKCQRCRQLRKIHLSSTQNAVKMLNENAETSSAG